MTTDTTSLDARIDALAIQIEQQILRQQQFLDNAPEFESKHRRMAEADIPSAEDLFSDAPHR